MSPTINTKTQPEKSTFGIFCLIESGLPPFSFEWYKNGQTFKSSARFDIETTKKSSILNIEKINKDDAGNYTCVVKNADGSDSLNVLLNVKGNSNYFNCYSVSS